MIKLMTASYCSDTGAASIGVAVFAPQTILEGRFWFTFLLFWTQHL